MKKVLIDCDPGMDDSMAIIMACKAPELDILAITTVNGNCPVDVTCANARKTLELVGRFDIPVARGMDRPLVRPSPKDPFSHGSDGQAEANLPDPRLPVSPMHAIDQIIETVKQYPGELHIIALAPMTNIAMAMLKAPEIRDQIAGIYAISGAFGFNKYAYANATGIAPQSEWNVYVDPEAAKIVYESGARLVALGLDVATHSDVTFSQDDLSALESSDRKEAKFLRNAIRFVTGRGFDSYCTIIDCMAVGYAIDTTLVETMVGRVGIETKDGLTLGMTVLDSRHHHYWEGLPLVAVGHKADYGRFMRLLMKCVLAQDVPRRG
jgi:inosine-uridine nucleoside N-ribohydrolase